MTIQFTATHIVIMFIALIVIIHSLLSKILDLIKTIIMINMYKKMAKMGTLSYNDMRKMFNLKDGESNKYVEGCNK